MSSREVTSMRAWRRRWCGRAAVAVAAASLMAGALATPGLADHEPGKAERDVYVPVADGTEELRARYRLPADGAPTEQVPTLLFYHGYTHRLPPLSDSFSEWANANGYALMAATVRGTGCSTGSWDFMAEQEAQDARDVVEWIADQPWSNGKVAMVGGSYTGFEQLRVASLAPEPLVAIAPANPIADLYRDVAYPGGIPNTTVGAGLTGLVVGASSAAAAFEPTEKGKAVCSQNQGEHLLQPTGTPAGFFAAHPFDDDEMRTRSPSSYDIALPTLTLIAWQDEVLGSRAIDSLSRISGPLHAVLTNGGHVDETCDPPSCPPFQKRYQVELTRFLDHYVKGLSNGYDEQDRVQVWWETQRAASGEEAPRWSTGLAHYPGQPSTPAELFLAPGGGLSETKQAGPADEYAYVGGSGQFRGFKESNIDWSPAPQPGASLAYTSPPLTKDLATLGSASLDLLLESSALDTDVQAVLTEVRPDGQEVYIQAGWLRASHRAEDPSRTLPTRPFHTHLDTDLEPMPVTTPTEVRVELLPFAHLFRKGSRIRVWLEAPANTFGRWGLAYLPGTAVNKVHYDPNRPSVLRLPRLPGHAAPEEAREHPACGTVLRQPCRPDPLADRKSI